jgi:hypothetical protein
VSLHSAKKSNNDDVKRVRAKTHTLFDSHNRSKIRIVLQCFILLILGQFLGGDGQYHPQGLPVEILVFGGQGLQFGGCQARRQGWVVVLLVESKERLSQKPLLVWLLVIDF